MEERDFLVEGQQSLVEDGLVLEDALVHTSKDGYIQLVLSNMSGLTQRVSEGTILGEAQCVEVLAPTADVDGDTQVSVQKVSSVDEQRKKQLLELLQLRDVPTSDAVQLQAFILDNHDVFSLVDGKVERPHLLR